MNETKKNIQKLRFKDFTQSKISYQYTSSNFNNNFNENKIIDYFNAFNETPIQVIFISNYIFDRLTNYGYSLFEYNDLQDVIDDLYNKILYESYVLFSLLVYRKYDILYSVDIPSVINQFELRNFSVLLYMMYIKLITKEFYKQVFDKLCTLIFNNDEIQTLSICFKEYNDAIKWLCLEKCFIDNQINLRYEVLRVLYRDLTNQYAIHSDINKLKLLYQYFANDLINDDIFIHQVCINKLLDKDFIDKVFYHTNNFDVIYKLHKQYKEYIKSLYVIKQLR